MQLKKKPSNNAINNDSNVKQLVPDNMRNCCLCVFENGKSHKQIIANICFPK